MIPFWSKLVLCLTLQWTLKYIVVEFVNWLILNLKLKYDKNLDDKNYSKTKWKIITIWIP